MSVSNVSFWPMRFPSLLLLFFFVSFEFGLARSSALQTAPAQTAEQVHSLIAKARVRTAIGDADGAAGLLKQALEASPDSVEVNLALGGLLLDRHLYPEAMDRFETVLAVDRHSSEARKGERSAALELALTSRRAGNQEAALLCLRHARESLPDDPTLLHALGIQLYDMHQLVSATEVLSEAVKYGPDQPENLYALARVELDRQLFPAAESHFRAYLAARPDDASAHYGYGHLLQMQQRVDEAESQFRRSIELQPTQTESYYQLGQMALDAHRDEEAKGYFQRTLSRAPGHGGALTGVGILAFRAKYYASAAASLRSAVAASPDYQPAHYYLGLTLARLGEKEASTDELKVAAELASRQQGKSNPVSPETGP